MIFDLSHPITHGMRTYPGLPGPHVGAHLSFEESRSHYDAGTEFTIGRVDMVTSTGTYLDAPHHRFPDGEDVANIDLERCVGLPVVLVDAQGAPSVTDGMVPKDVHGAAVLFHTGWDRFWGTDEYGTDQHPHLTVAAAETLIAAGAALVGVDSVNVDDTRTGGRPIHTLLLAAGVLIVENLTSLGSLPSHGATFYAAPLPVLGAPSYPVRAFAVAAER